MGSDGSRSTALSQPQRDMKAQSSAAPRESLLLYDSPLTVLAVGAMLKCGSYLSVANCFSRAKEQHVTQGYPWTGVSFNWRPESQPRASRGESARQSAGGLSSAESFFCTREIEILLGTFHAQTLTHKHWANSGCGTVCEVDVQQSHTHTKNRCPAASSWRNTTSQDTWFVFSICSQMQWR